MTHPRVPAVPGAGAAAFAWIAVLVSLNVTGHPLVAGATFAGLALLAIRHGRARLVTLSLVVGAGLLLAVPGVALVDGSFELAFADGAWRAPSDAAGWARALGGALRIPAQVLASVYLLLVPAELLLAGAARVSPRTALLGALAARLRPLLSRDLRLVREELASRGLRIDRGAPVRERAAAVVALWEATISGMLDRAFQTAAVLEARGYGAAPATSEPLEHPDLASGARRSPALDALLVLEAALLVSVVLAARASGAAAAPALHALGGAHQPTPALVVVAALLGLALGITPLAWRVKARQLPALGNRAPHAARTSAPLQLVLERVRMHHPRAAAPSLVAAGLRVAPGELVVVAGASGSGKSTLLDVVTGVAPRTTGGVRSGVVRLGPHVLGATRDPSCARVAAVFQDPEGQVLVGRVAEEVAFGLRHAGVAVAVVERRVLDVLDELGLRHLARRDCATLSGGELQRVLLAAALALDPALLVLDEPTSQLDAASERRFWEVVDHVRRERGVGVLAAEHRLDHVLLRADRVVVLDRGCSVLEVAPADIPAAAPQLVASPFTGLAPRPSPTGPPRLAVRIERLDVDRGASTRTLLRGLAFAAPPGAVVTLEGANGSGKSTLLRAICGLHPTHGAVLVDGWEVTALDRSARRIAYLSQAAGALLPGRTVWHAASDGCRRLGVDVAAASEALDAAGLAGMADRHPAELSVGERQRLALVVATSHRPPVWLLDEPTRGMDLAGRRWVACQVLAHAAAGGVVLVATHDPSLAAAVATHRLRLDLRTGPTLLPVARDASGRLVEPGTSTEAQWTVAP